ncbi:unnamed protein product [[Candida] boidinii]|nr:unnamed protein product [[Candida] boidinii]
MNRKSTLPPRARGSSKGLPPTVAYNSPAPVVINPENLVLRQWPIFNWSGSSKVVKIIPSSDGYGHQRHNVQVVETSEVLKAEPLFQSFPGPLSKNKTKRKDVSKWIEDKVASLGGDIAGPMTTPHLLIWGILHVMVNEINKPGDFTSREYLQKIAKVLDSSVQLGTDEVFDLLSINRVVQQSVMANKPQNAQKCDGSGLISVYNFLQAGEKQRALSFAIGEGDWALALCIAKLISEQCFLEITKLYAKYNFTQDDALQKNLSFFLQCSFQGFNASQFTGQTTWLSEHFRSIIPFILLNNSDPGNFLFGLAELFSREGFKEYSRICFLLSGIPFIPSKLSALESDIDSLIIEEIFDYVLLSSNNISAALASGLPHLLPIRVIHAATLLDYGHVTEAKKYSEVINAAIKSKSAFIDKNIIQASHALADRLSVQSDSGSETGWFSSKVSSQKLWTQLDKSFNRFVAGEDLTQSTAAPTPPTEGTFSKFSPSVSREQSFLDMSQLSKTERPQLISTQSHGYAPPHGGLDYAQPQYNTHDFNASPYPVDSFANSKPSKYAPASFNIGGSSTSLSGMNINPPAQIAPPHNAPNPISSPQNHLVRTNTAGLSGRVPVLPNNNANIANSMRNLPPKGPQGVPPSLVQQANKHSNPLADLYAPPPPINGGMTTPRMSPRGSFAEPMATPSPSGSVTSRKSRYAPVTGSPTPAPASTHATSISSTSVSSTSTLSITIYSSSI